MSSPESDDRCQLCPPYARFNNLYCIALRHACVAVPRASLFSRTSRPVGLQLPGCVTPRQMTRAARTTDWLTGVADHRAFKSYVQALLSRATDTTRFSLLCVDLDKFGYVNHFIGFIEADRALAKLAAAVSGMVPSDGFFARTGSDEFAVVLPDTREGCRGSKLAHQLLDTVRESLQYLATPDALVEMSTAISPFTASIGVVSFSACSSLTFEDLVREGFGRAEFAKRGGRDRVWAKLVPVEESASVAACQQ